MKVWIDQDLCTGDGICAEIAPDVFTMRSDGLYVVKEEAEHFGSKTLFDGGDGPGHGPDYAAGLARVPAGQEAIVIEAAEECPGECIFIEI